MKGGAFNRVLMEKCSIEHGKLILTGLSIEPVGKTKLSSWAEVSIYVSPKGFDNPEKEGAKLVYRLKIDRPGKGGAISFPDVSTPVNIPKGWVHGAMVLKWETNGIPERLQISIFVSAGSS